MKGFFVTGTDTNVGKTFVTCALARLAVAQGQRVFAFKPIETGCARVDGRLVGSDQEAISTAAGNWQEGTLRGLYRYEPAVAPYVASEPASPIDLDAICNVIQSQSRADLVVVEGAGGWRVPITRTADMSRLALLVGLPILVVARAGLGTINHSLLTLEAIERDGGQIAGLILSQLPSDDPALAKSNETEISRRWPGRIVRLQSDPNVLRCFT